MSAKQRLQMIGKRVQVDHDDLSKSFGIVRAISRRGHKIECDGGGTIYAAWWRLRVIDDADTSEETP